MKLFLPNLAFEEQLLNFRSGASKSTNRSIAELAPLMALLADAGDVVQCPQPVDPASSSTCLNHVSFETDVAAATQFSAVVPWGWTKETAAAASIHGMPSEHVPNTEAVKAVNSRKFNAAFDQVNCAGSMSFPFGNEAFGQMCRNVAEWRVAVMTLQQFGHDRWVAKPQFSHAGRNRLLAHGTELNEAQLGWLRKQFRDPSGVYVEPWVQPMEQAGLQFDISRGANGEKRMRCVGVTQLLTDHVGRYFGSLIHANDLLEQEWRTAVEHGHHVSVAAAKAGYFGPLGIDCFRFRTADGAMATRLCNDINGRFTMGRLALQLRPRLREKPVALWCQVATSRFPEFPDSLPETLHQWGFGNVEAEVTSPQVIGNAAVANSTVLFAGSSRAELLKLAETLQARPKPE